MRQQGEEDTALPAFYDTHNPLREATNNLALVPVEQAHSIVEFVALISARAAWRARLSRWKMILYVVTGGVEWTATHFWNGGWSNTRSNRMSTPNSVDSPQGIVTRASPYTVAETLGKLETILHTKGLALFAHIDHSGEAERVGLTMQAAHVLIFGNPKAGMPLMRARPLLALDLPLKALVWQDSAGQVWVSYTSTAFLASRYAIPDELVPHIAGIDALVEAALHS